MIAYLAGHCSGSGLTWVEAIRPPHAETHSLSYLNKFVNACPSPEISSRGDLIRYAEISSRGNLRPETV